LAERYQSLRRLKEDSIRLVREFVLTKGGIEVDGGVLRSGEIAGWRLPLPIPGHRVVARLALTLDFPFKPPRITLEEGPYFLRIPHVDESEVLCLNPHATTFSPDQPVEVTRLILDKAAEIVAEGLAGWNREDFVAEFRNYWDGYRDSQQNRVRSLLTRFDRTRLISYWAGKDFWVVGENREQIEQWLGRVYREKRDAKRQIRETVFVALPAPLYPLDYPRTNADFQRMAQADSLLAQIVPQENRDLPVVFAFLGEAGPVLAGLRLQDPTVPLSAPGTKVRHSARDGFRPGKIPAQHLLPRYYGPSPAFPLAVDRIDSQWLQERGGSGFDRSLAGRTVAIVGCGSLGASVALALCQSGVGRLRLIDNQIYSWDNVARHVLPGDYVGYAKDDSLKTFLAQIAPSADITASNQRSLQQVMERDPTFAEIELVVSTTGDWATEAYLNAAARTTRVFPNVVYGWTEPFGVAGHALACLQQGGCLACGCDQTGLFQNRITNWPIGRQIFNQAAGCSDLFQPYGVLDVAPVRGMIADVALKVLRRELTSSTHFSWIGEVSRIGALGARVSEAWIGRTKGSPGCQRFQTPWNPHGKCPLCSE